jgi:uncharacterized protein YbjQ (UPF0145 family)
MPSARDCLQPSLEAATAIEKGGDIKMILTTTDTIEGRTIADYKGIVTGEAILGTNIFRDLFAGIRDLVGGRSGAYEEVLKEARETALRELREQAAALGANAVIGVDIDYETISTGSSGSMMMVSASGTAVLIR